MPSELQGSNSAVTLAKRHKIRSTRLSASFVFVRGLPYYVFCISNTLYSYPRQTHGFRMNWSRASLLHFAETRLRQAGQLLAARSLRSPRSRHPIRPPQWLNLAQITNSLLHPHPPHHLYPYMTRVFVRRPFINVIFRPYFRNLFAPSLSAHSFKITSGDEGEMDCYCAKPRRALFSF